MKRTLLFFAALLLAPTSWAQLNPGDLAIIGFNAANPDEFAFTAVKFIPAGQVIYFADCGVNDDGTFRNNEGGVTYTVPAGGLAPGSIVTYTGVGGDFAADALLCTGSFAFATNGDQVVAYQVAEDGTTITYLYIVTFHATSFDADATTSNNTALPPGLSLGSTAVALGNVDNGEYTAASVTGSPSEILTALTTSSNWTTSNNRLPAPFALATTTVDFCSGASSACEASANAEGWRMLSVPGTGLTPTSLSALNLVRGIAASDTDPANLYTIYGGDQTPGGNDGYTAPGASDALVPGAGFFWYLFDSTDRPVLSGNGLGAIQSLPIALTGSTTPLAADQTVQFPVRATNDGFYLGGNPFDSDFDLNSGSTERITATLSGGGALDISDVVSIWDAAANSGAGGYVSYSLAGTGNPTVVTPWQGFWLEITDPNAGSAPPTTDGVDVTYAVAGAGASSGTFVGRQAAFADLKLKLRGTATDGRALANEVSLLFHDEATDGWDRFDGSSPGSFGTPYVLAGLLGQRGDEEVWKYQDSRSLADGVYTFDLAYTGFGVETAYELAWPSLDNVPEAWTLTLRDRMTGTEVDLRTTASYAFEAMEGEPDARFEVVVGANPVANEGNTLPASFAVGEAYPNPTTSVATLAVTVDRAQDVEVAVYDVLGRLVLADAVTLRGGASEQVEVGVAALPAGTYVVRVTGEAMSATRRLTVVR